MCPSLYTPVHPSRTLPFQLSLKPSCQSASRLTAQRERERDARSVQLARAAIFPHARKRRTTDSPDGIANSGVHAHHAQRERNTHAHAGRPTGRYLARIKHASGSDTRAARTLKLAGHMLARNTSSRENVPLRLFREIPQIHESKFLLQKCQKTENFVAIATGVLKCVYVFMKIDKHM